MVKKRILIVDDDEAVRTVLKDLLEDEGYICETAADGEDGLTKIKTQDFALVLLDIKLPDMNGTDVLRSIRKIKPELTAIMITGFPSRKTVEQSIGLEAFNYVTKPIDFKKLMSVIEVPALFQPL